VYRGDTVRSMTALSTTIRTSSGGPGVRVTRGGRNPRGCGGCLGSVVLTMLLAAAVIWAMNPEMSVQEAARSGILVGGGLSVGLMGLLCGVPLLLVIGVVGWLLVFGRRSRSGAPTSAAPGRVVIDVDPED